MIIVVGAVPFNFFFNKGELRKSRGNLRTKGPYTFLPTWHPAAIGYAGGLTDEKGRKIYDTIKHDFVKARKFVDGTLFSGRDYTIVTPENLDYWTKFLKEQPRLAIDIESTSLHTWESVPSAISCIAFTWKEKVGVCIPLDHRENIDMAFRERARNAVNEILTCDCVKDFHNAKYDVPYLHQLGYGPVRGKIRCTMLMAYQTDENNKGYSLKKLAAERLDGYSNIIEDFRTAKLDKLAYYNCEDTDNTYRLGDIYVPMMDEGLWWIHDNILIPGSMALAEMERIGVKIDLGAFKKLRLELQKELAKKVASIDSVMTEGTCTSPLDLSHFLFDELGYPAIRRTKTGISTDEDTLKVLSDEYKCKLADRVLEVRKLSKLINTYLAPYPKMAAADGRIHCSFLMFTTVTGRLSSMNPNLQQVPRDKRIRRMFVATKGNVLLHGDLSQAELRIACSLAEEPTLMDGYNKDLDAHKLTASMLGRIEYDKVTKVQRQNAKPVNFGLIYKMSAEGLRRYAKSSYGIKFSKMQASRWRDRFLDTYQFMPWWGEVTRELYDFGYVKSKLGRIRRLPAIYSDDPMLVGEAERQAVNFKVQSLASDLTMLILIYCHEQFIARNMKAKLVLTVHDSVMIDLPHEEVDEAVGIIKEILATFKDLEWLMVPLPMDLEVGERWGEMKEIK